jgi:hypothetical protein
MQQSGSNGDDEVTIQPRRSIVVNVGLRIIAIELFLLLTLIIRSDFVLIFVLPFAIIVILWPYICAGIVLIKNGPRKLAREIARRAKDRRTYQFSIRSLLILFVIVAIICAWYRHRLNVLYQEQRLVYGKWKVLYDISGKPMLHNGAEQITTLDENNCKIYPNHEPKWMDIFDHNSTNECIYCFKGEKLRLDLSLPGSGRPESFSRDADFEVSPGVYGNRALGKGVVILLERIPEEPPHK